MSDPQKRTVRTRKGVREYTFLGCPLTRQRSAWCFRLCQPDENGKGQCGRVAPHGLVGRTAIAIARHQARTARHESLEQLYLTAGAPPEPGIRVTHGEAEIVVADPEGAPLLQVMHDAAAYAISSLLWEQLARTLSFTVELTGAEPAGELIARGRHVGGSGDRFLAEARLTDSAGVEIGRGEGTFVAREGPASPA
jgi:hypothetical protein